jgi:hypothetical protein
VERPERRGERVQHRFLTMTWNLQGEPSPMRCRRRGSNVAGRVKMECVGLHSASRRASFGMHASELGSAAPKQPRWIRLTAIAAHHVALARVLDTQSHNFDCVACLCLLCEGQQPVKAINKERIGQAGVDSHLHTLTAVIVVCTNIAHSSPACT